MTMLRDLQRVKITMAAVFLLAVCNPLVAQSHETDKGTLSMALTYDALTSSDISANHALLQGGALDIAATTPFYGLGVVASVTGVTVHNSANINNVPVNLVVVAFGPRYTWTMKPVHGHSLKIFGQALIGEADGFKGLYPAPGATIDSTNSLAIQPGIGVDLAIAHHFSVRLLQVDYLRTQLPDAAMNVQNSVRFGAGIVFHTR